MLHHTLGGAGILFSLQHLNAPALDSLPCLQARGMRDCNKGSKFKREIEVLQKNSPVFVIQSTNLFYTSNCFQLYFSFNMEI